jgi:hypothetical protein
MCVAGAVLAEGTLGLFVHDFIFEREVQEDDTVRTLSSGIKVGEKEPPSKRYKAESQPKPHLLMGTSSQSGPKSADVSSSKDNQQQKANQISYSAPSKMSSINSEKNKDVVICQDQPKKLSIPDEVQDPSVKEVETNEDRVHIPENFEDSDMESETLSERLRGIGAFTGEGQCSKQNEDIENQQVWQMEVDKDTEPTGYILNTKIQDQSKGCSKSCDVLNLSSDGHPPQMVIPSNTEGVNDEIINSQESVITDDGNDNAQVQVVKLVESQGDPVGAGNDVMEIQPERRRSERLKKDIHLTTMEKNEAYAKKRCLEGTTDTSHSLSGIDNVQLNDLAKNMGVVIHDPKFATFDILKDLEAARNCLFNKHQKKTY